MIALIDECNQLNINAYPWAFPLRAYTRLIAVPNVRAYLFLGITYYYYYLGGGPGSDLKKMTLFLCKGGVFPTNTKL